MLLLLWLILGFTGGSNMSTSLCKDIEVANHLPKGQNSTWHSVTTIGKNKQTRVTICSIFGLLGHCQHHYPSSHNHGSSTWVPQILIYLSTIPAFSIIFHAMIVGEFAWFLLKNLTMFPLLNPSCLAFPPGSSSAPNDPAVPAFQAGL